MSGTIIMRKAFGRKAIVLSQNKEGSLPVATLSIALYVLRRSMSASDTGFININKDTSAFENLHLCLRKKNRQLGHISVATGRISSLFCDSIIYLSTLFMLA